MTRRGRAMTMAEVLVVLAILATLTGLLVPALAHAREAGRAGRCASNLRQMAIAAEVYATVYAHYPAALRYEHVDLSMHVVAWDWETTLAGDVVGPGPLWGFTDDPGSVQQCPSHRGASNFADPSTGYNYNTTYVGGEGSFPMTGWGHVRPGVRVAAVRRSATCAVFGDGGVVGGVANKFMRAPGNSVEGDLTVVYAGGQAFRHGGATNVAWLDGHVGGTDRPHSGTHATGPLLDLMGYPSNGFLSDDDAAYEP